ncbi:hypothetical protein QN409_11500 [Pseudomonas sp. MH9.3]|nr:hypothetical protein [Pseudomonas sp. MH9.3]MEB0106955.1 hypothetical protein [Pseudomonas sp. MH9.3]WQG59090.1 hypothetical protein RHM66_07085 [Pseudomonas sp. RTB3]
MINFAAGDPDGQSNDRFNAWNYLVIVSGIAVWCLTVLRLWMFYPR